MIGKRGKNEQKGHFRISSQVPSTTQPPFLRLVKSRYFDFATIRFTKSRPQKTSAANLARHVQSENYYARIRVRGKLIWSGTSSKIKNPSNTA